MHNEFPIPHEILESNRFKRMKISSKYLFVILCKLKNRFGDSEGKFFRRIDDLMVDSGLGRSSITRAKKELVKEEFLIIEEGLSSETYLRSADWFMVNRLQTVSKW